MYLGVVGSRAWTDRKLFWRHLGAWHRAFPDLHVVSGGASEGADRLAELWCRQNGVPFTIYPAKWTRDDGSKDRGAGKTRNSCIVGASEQILAFWDGESTGTADTIAKGRKKGISVWIVSPDGKHRTV